MDGILFASLQWLARGLPLWGASKRALGIDVKAEGLGMRVSWSSGGRIALGDMGFEVFVR